MALSLTANTLYQHILSRTPTTLPNTITTVAPPPILWPHPWAASPLVGGRPLFSDFPTKNGDHPSQNLPWKMVTPEKLIIVSGTLEVVMMMWWYMVLADLVILYVSVFFWESMSWLWLSCLLHLREAFWNRSSIGNRYWNTSRRYNLPCPHPPKGFCGFGLPGNPTTRGVRWWNSVCVCVCVWVIICIVF